MSTSDRKKRGRPTARAKNLGKAKSLPPSSATEPKSAGVSSTSAGAKAPTSVGAKAPTAAGSKAPTSAGAAKAPTSVGAKAPTAAGIKTPTSAGTTAMPTSSGVKAPTAAGIKAPTSAGATATPTSSGVKAPTALGAKAPTAAGIKAPTAAGIKAPTSAGATATPTSSGVKTPTALGAKAPTAAGIKAPTSADITASPTSSGTKASTAAGAKVPTSVDVKAPTAAGVKAPTAAGVKAPTAAGETKSPTPTGAKAPSNDGLDAPKRRDDEPAKSADAPTTVDRAAPAPAARARPAGRKPRPLGGEPEAVARAAPFSTDPPGAKRPPAPAPTEAPSPARPRAEAKRPPSGRPTARRAEPAPTKPKVEPGLLAEAMFAPAPAFEVAIDDDDESLDRPVEPARPPPRIPTRFTAPLPDVVVAPEPAAEVFAGDSMMPPAPDGDGADELYAFEDHVERLHRDGAAATDGASRAQAAKLVEELAGSLGGADTARSAAAKAPFGPREALHEVDDFGLDRAYVTRTRAVVHGLYKSWFRTLARGVENVPAEGPVLVVANHGGVLPWDGLMLRTALELEHPTHRELRWLVDDSTFHAPFVGTVATRLGAVRACPENAERLLSDGRLVAVFPEGDKGATKPFARRYELQRFGRGGYVKLALRTRAKIVPVAVVGAEEAHPMLFSTGRLAKLFGLSWLPITPTFPWLGPLGLVPLPSRWVILFGEPLSLDDVPAGAENDDVLVGRINEEVRESVQDLVRKALSLRPAPYLG